MKKIMNKKGFSLVEIMVVTLIFVSILTMIHLSMVVSQDAWNDTESNIVTQENIRQVMARISVELRESGDDSGGTLQVQILDGTGVNGADILRFSIPVICQAGMSVMDNNGDVAYWGAPLTWGCQSSSCMDGDDDCGTVEYKYVEYRINANEEMERRVLDNTMTVVGTEVFGRNITDFQVVLSGGQNVVTINLTAMETTGVGRAVISTESMDVVLRNKG